MTAVNKGSLLDAGARSVAVLTLLLNMIAPGLAQPQSTNRSAQEASGAEISLPKAINVPVLNKGNLLPRMGRPRVAIALGGGGVRGAAHVGVLRVLRQAGIPIDIIAGTSMGAIVGGLYSAGVSLDSIEEI